MSEISTMSETNISDPKKTDQIPTTYNGGVFSIGKPKSKSRKCCCVPRCTSKGVNVSFHIFPKNKKLNKLWKIKCRIAKNISAHSAVCSKHFLKSDYFPGRGIGDNTSKIVLLKTAVPSQNLPVASHGRRTNLVQNQNRTQRLLQRRMQQSLRPNTAVNQLTVEKSNKSDQNVQLDVKPKIEKLSFEGLERIHMNISTVKKEEKRQIETTGDTKHRINVMDFLASRTQLNAWTGIPTFFLLRKIEERVRSTNPKEIEVNGLSTMERILLCFIKLKTKLPSTCLTSIFGVTNASVSRNINATLPLIKEALEDIDFFSSSCKTNDNQVVALRMYGYDAARAVLDCKEAEPQKCDNCRECKCASQGSNEFRMDIERDPLGTDFCSAIVQQKSVAKNSI